MTERDFEDVFQHTAARRRLNPDMRGSATEPMFQHTAARRQLVSIVAICFFFRMVSTHSRPKAAGVAFFAPVAAYADVSTHSRLKAAGQQGRNQRPSPKFQHTAA